MLAQIFHALRCVCSQIIEPPEHDRFGWTNFCACGNESAFLSIVTERTFESAAGIRQGSRPAIDYPERTRDNAIAASITDIILHENGTGFSANNRACGTRFQATGFFTMLANIRKKNPAKRIFSVAERHCTGDLVTFLTVLFKKHHMAPGRCAKEAGIIVGISRPREAIIRHLVPFFARYLTSLTADAYSWIGEETDFDVFLHVIVPTLVRAVCAFADHRLSIFPSKP